jgi:acetyl-CoA carboxylase biotin carboxyl carrier protein
MSKLPELKLQQTLTYFDALQILRIVKETEDCESINLRFGGMTLSVTRAERPEGPPDGAAGPAESAPPAPTQVQARQPAQATACGAATAAVSIAAPMVGNFHRSSDPEAAPFVQIGDVVMESDTVGLVKALHLCKPVTAGVAGRVVDILVEDADFVEFGQPVLLVEPI